MKRADRVPRATTPCPVCAQPVGLIKTSWNGGRQNPKAARHKPVPGGPWCAGSGLAVPAATVLTR